MFDISGLEFLTLAAIAVFIFGPDRLPKLAHDAGKFIRQARSFIHGAKQDLARELDMDLPDLRNVDLSARGLIRKTLGEEDPFVDLKKDFRGEFDLLKAPLMRETGARPLEPNEAPPWDPDTT
ncbi:MAG: twin-arginine translocase TatA/TatE family subunit [Sporichthyaceae bacterium]